MYLEHRRIGANEHHLNNDDSENIQNPAVLQENHTLNPEAR